MRVVEAVPLGAVEMGAHMGWKWGGNEGLGSAGSASTFIGRDSPHQSPLFTNFMAAERLGCTRRGLLDTVNLHRW
jgi:hypothetical protein